MTACTRTRLWNKWASPASNTDDEARMTENVRLLTNKAMRRGFSYVSHASVDIGFRPSLVIRASLLSLAHSYETKHEILVADWLASAGWTGSIVLRSVDY